MAVMADVVRRRGYCLVGAMTVITVLALLLGLNPVCGCYGFNAGAATPAHGAALASSSSQSFGFHVAVFPLNTCIDSSFALDRPGPELDSAQPYTPGGRLRLASGSLLSGRPVLSRLRRIVCRMANIPPPPFTAL
jgi:hypothetical protein